jgi:hypothetical protein
MAQGSWRTNTKPLPGSDVLGNDVLASQKTVVDDDREDRSMLDSAAERVKPIISGSVLSSAQGFVPVDGRCRYVYLLEGRGGIVSSGSLGPL